MRCSKENCCIQCRQSHFSGNHDIKGQTYNGTRQTEQDDARNVQHEIFWECFLYFYVKTKILKKMLS